MESTPDTSSYMIAGFMVSFVSMGLYLASIYIRNRNLHRDLEVMQELQSDKKKK